MNVWMYAVREFEDAIDDCTSCTSNCNEHSTNSDSVHAWDEGVAFYTGSLEGTAYGGNSNGKLLLPALKPPNLSRTPALTSAAPQPSAARQPSAAPRPSAAPQS